ncbi:MAG: hypothetical protein KA780_10050 [Prolixibacteraceae bacterium]|jgi:hypothetical protein|nr:hypothetical protein [Prolixibacteraceae bacterium]HNQ36604.1 hypothetical protein [Prolixibacteraceae bacterium]HOY51179.1 hypothetical protein [Prolixibacteraceae bacterium]
MKKTIFSLLTIFSLGLLLSCDKDTGLEDVTDPDATLGKVGNYWNLKSTGYANSKITISSNTNGEVVGSYTFNGKTYTLEGKITENGIYDFVYSNGDKSKPFTLVKFDARVGDKWEYKVGNQTVVRKVVHKSTEDDTFYGPMIIKTIDVEETIPEGVQVKGAASPFTKILWKFNHKFGFIMATGTRANGSIVNLYSDDTNAND